MTGVYIYIHVQNKENNVNVKIYFKTYLQIYIYIYICIYIFTDLYIYISIFFNFFNRQPLNDIYICPTAPLTSRCCILYIYSTNISTEYFKHAAHSPFFPLQNAVYFIMLPFFGSCIIHVLNTGCAKNLEENSGA